MSLQNEKKIELNIEIILSNDKHRVFFLSLDCLHGIDDTVVLQQPIRPQGAVWQ